MAKGNTMDADRKPARIIGYVRVSTEEQATEGVSLAAQRRKVELYAELHGLALVDIVEDPGASAKTLARPGLERAVRMLVDGEADGLVVAKLDRLTRSVRDLDALLELCFAEDARYPVALVSVAENVDTRTAAGRLVLNVLTSVAQWEREAIGERTRDALAHKRHIGEVYGPVPFGLAEESGRLVEEEGEADALALMLGMRQDGASYRAIAKALDARGVPTKRGGKGWGPSAVKYILDRQAGQRRAKPRRKVPAIVEAVTA